jgi:hypothetical protein
MELNIPHCSSFGNMQCLLLVLLLLPLHLGTATKGPQGTLSQHGTAILTQNNQQLLPKYIVHMDVEKFKRFNYSALRNYYRPSFPVLIEKPELFLSCFSYIIWKRDLLYHHRMDFMSM